jgi:ribosomal protein S18 acetylase RimI-like enzyme
MKQKMRSYQNENDYWRIREFLRRVFLLNNMRDLSWQTDHFDYWRWHGIENLGHGQLEKDVFIWETQQGEIVAVLNSEEPGYAYLQVDPGKRTPELETEMLSIAEEKLAVKNPEGQLRLNVFADQGDDLRQDILKHRRYTKSEYWQHHHRRPMSQTVPEPELPDGYRVRALGDVTELPARSFLFWRAFHPDEPDDRYEGWEWYLNIQRAPLYRRDLDLVAVSPKGELVSLCTIWFDDVTRSGSFEPVGTDPDHQRRGLGKAVVHEGLRRLDKLGAVIAFVGSGSVEASEFYTSIGFTELDKSEMWIKDL